MAPWRINAIVEAVSDRHVSPTGVIWEYGDEKTPEEPKFFRGWSALKEYTPEDSKQGDSTNENKGFSDCVSESAAECAASGDESAMLAYLRRGWSGVPEGVLLEALAILNNAGVNQ